MKIFESDMGYCELQAPHKILLVNHLTTTSLKRSFSTMNRILSKARNRMKPEMLNHCTSIEVPEEMDDFLDRIVDLYAFKNFGDFCFCLCECYMFYYVCIVLLVI